VAPCVDAAHSGVGDPHFCFVLRETGGFIQRGKLLPELSDSAIALSTDIHDIPQFRMRRMAIRMLAQEIAQRRQRRRRIDAARLELRSD